MSNFEILPSKNDGIYTDIVTDNYSVVYNPKGYAGIIILDADATSLLQLCDGNTTVEEMSDELRLDREIIVDALSNLTKIGLLINNSVKEIKKHNNRKLDCWLHLTNECNLACTYCYITKSRESMSFITAKKSLEVIIETARRHNYSEIQIRFSGGEPLLAFPLLKEIIAYIKEQYSEFVWHFAILTNGTLINDKIAQYIKDKEIGVGISLDGVEDYNNCRKDTTGKNTFNRVVAGIDHLLKFGIKVGLLTTVSKCNLDGLPLLTKFFIERGLTFRFSLEKNIVTGNTSLFRNYNEIIQILTECLEIMNDYIDTGITNFNFKFGDIDLTRPTKRVCSAGYNSFAFGHSGEIGLCGMSLISPLSSVYEISDLWDLRNAESNILSAFTIEQVSKCADCFWKYSCKNGCPLQNQATNCDINELSPYCSVYKAILPLYVKMIGRKMIVKNRTKFL